MRHHRDPRNKTDEKGGGDYGELHGRTLPLTPYSPVEARILRGKEAL